MKQKSLANYAEEGYMSYMTQVRQYPILTEEEENRLATAVYDKQDVNAAEKLVTSHLRLVTKIAFEMRGYGMSIMDMVGEGCIGLMQAVKKYNPYLGLYGCNYDIGSLEFGTSNPACFIAHGGRGNTIGFSRTEDANAIKMHVFGGVRYHWTPDLPYSTNAALGRSLNNALTILLTIGERGHASFGELNALCRDAYNKTACFHTTKSTLAKHHLWYKSDFGSSNNAYMAAVNVHAAAKNITTTGIHNIKAKLLPATDVGLGVATRDEELIKTFVPASDMGASGNNADDPNIKLMSTSRSSVVVLDIEVGRYSMDGDIKTYSTTEALLLAFDNIPSVSNWVLPYALVGAISELCHA